MFIQTSKTKIKNIPLMCEKNENALGDQRSYVKINLKYL